MDFELTEIQRDIQKVCRDLAARELTPNARKWDEAHEWPAAAVKKLAELSLLAVAVPEAWGGAGLDNVCYAVAIEEIARGCASTGVIMSVNNSLYCDPLLKFGTDEQKKEFLTPFARGEKLGCFGLTEPEPAPTPPPRRPWREAGRRVRHQRLEELHHLRPRGRRHRGLRRHRRPPATRASPPSWCPRTRPGLQPRHRRNASSASGAAHSCSILRRLPRAAAEPARRGGRRLQGRHGRPSTAAASASPPRPSASPGPPSRRPWRTRPSARRSASPFATSRPSSS